MTLNYLQVLLYHLFAPTGKKADFDYVHPPAYKEFYALVIFDVPIYGFLTVVDLSGNIRRGNFLFGRGAIGVRPENLTFCATFLYVPPRLLSLGPTSWILQIQ